MSLELARLFAAAIVNPTFKDKLVTTIVPGEIQALSYRDESFSLTPEETAGLANAVAHNHGNLQKIAEEVAKTEESTSLSNTSFRQLLPQYPQLRRSLEF